jgi:hypothetical protein
MKQSLVMKKLEKKKSTKPSKPTIEESKKVSKTWLAVLVNVGTSEILDMRAVLK